MQIIKVIRNKDDGTVEATFALTEDQTRFLLNFAIGILVNNGLAQVIEQEELEEQSQQEQPAVAPEKLN